MARVRRIPAGRINHVRNPAANTAQSVTTGSTSEHSPHSRAVSQATETQFIHTPSEATDRHDPAHDNTTKMRWPLFCRQQIARMDRVTALEDCAWNTDTTTTIRGI